MSADPLASNADTWARDSDVLAVVEARRGLQHEAARDFRLWAVEARIRGAEVEADDLEWLADRVELYVSMVASVSWERGW